MGLSIKQDDINEVWVLLWNVAAAQAYWLCFLPTSGSLRAVLPWHSLGSV